VIERPRRRRQQEDVVTRRPRRRRRIDASVLHAVKTPRGVFMPPLRIAVLHARRRTAGKASPPADFLQVTPIGGRDLRRSPVHGSAVVPGTEGEGKECAMRKDANDE